MANNGFDIEIDEITLAAARRGDMNACEKIYRAFERPAFSAALRVCRCRELAQDVTQEAFISAFRRIRQFRGDAPFWGWLRRVVINHAISALRKQPKVDLVVFEDYQACTQGQQEDMGKAMDLDSALAHLDDEDRVVVWMHDVEGFKHQEIARFFGKTESFSKTRLSRARQRLKDLLLESADQPLAKTVT